MTRNQSFSEFELAGWENESTAAEYDRHLSLVTTQSIEALLDDAHLRSGHKVLDIATGAGYVAAAAARRGAQPVGLDFSATQVRLARERYPNIRFEQGDAEALPFEADTFETVVNAFGLCHLPNPDLALRLGLADLMRSAPDRMPARSPLDERSFLQPGRSFVGEAHANLGRAAGLDIRDPTADARVLAYTWSVPDEVFEAGEHLARQLGVSRSQLYSDALATYLSARGAQEVTARLNAIFAAQPADLDPALNRAQLKTLADEAW